MSRDDERWMARALCLASLSLGRTWPNPGVGCVIVRDGVLLGQGRHEVCGQEHAEVRALADCRRRGNDPAGATVYVTLAPCTRTGKQPPCVRALFGARVARVVAAIPDPNQDDPVPQMRGIHYRVGCLAEVAEQVHGGFLKRVRTGMPRVTAKWAMTADGFLATSNGASSWISSPEALALSRRRRRAFDAILVGAGTARRDDPQLLSSRPRAHGEQSGPLRVVVSASGELKPKSRLLASVAQAPLLVVVASTLAENRRGDLRRAGAQVRSVDDPHDPTQVLKALGDLGINDLLVEGGAALHGAWLRAGAFDRLELYLGLRTLGGGTPVAAGEGAATLGHAQEWLPEVGPIALGTTMCLRMRRA